MMDSSKVAAFISAKRRSKGLTQQQVAQRLSISFQAVSKWENGTTFPNTELLPALADLLGVTVDEMLRGHETADASFSYRKAGVDIDYTDTLKRDMGGIIATDNPRVLNGLGQFASLYDIGFDGIANPVLVLKSEEPGSKQKLAMEYGFVESICHDMINHLVNDIAVMGAAPLAVLDTIVCGQAEKETINSIVRGIAEACRQNECALVGGETSVQPGIIDSGTYILTSTVAGIVDRTNIIDGSRIAAGDIVLAAASNGLHTNGYSLVRMLMDEMPHIKREKVGDESFIDAIMRPHTAYYRAIKPLFGSGKLKGMAHITGGGIEGNLKRIMPDGLCACVDLSKLKPLPLFKYLKDNGNIEDSEMLSTFNCGVGLVLVVEPACAEYVAERVGRYYDCYPIGQVTEGGAGVEFVNAPVW